MVLNSRLGFGFDDKDYQSKYVIFPLHIVVLKNLFSNEKKKGKAERSKRLVKQRICWEMRKT